MKKRILSMVLVLLTVLTLLPGLAFADNASPLGDIDIFGSLINLIGGDVDIEGPEDVTVLAGEDATFEVVVNKGLTDLLTDYKYIWLNLNSADITQEDLNAADYYSMLTKLGSKVASITPKLTVKDVRASDDGHKFVCLVYALQGKSFSFGVSRVATLTVLPMTDCPHKTLVEVAEKAPDCTETGYAMHYECKTCGNLFRDPNALRVTTMDQLRTPALGHQLEGGYKMDPTCTEPGYIFGGVCQICKKKIDETVILPATGHKEQTLTEAVEPTCTENGMTAGIVCSECGTILSEAKTVPAKGHSFKGYKCADCGLIQKNPFADVTAGDYYYEPVLWAYYSDPQITTGKDSIRFAPGDACTRGQVVTFLWRAAGCPEPMLKAGPFFDVQRDSYCYKAVLWAYENGITTGTTATSFAPNAKVTRAQFVTFLWRYREKPEVKSVSSPFADVQDPSSPFYYAIIWAAETGVTTGKTAYSFAPNDVCTRGNVVTFLYRDAMNQK